MNGEFWDNKAQNIRNLKYHFYLLKKTLKINKFKQMDWHLS